jgi:hypothetical protein
MVLVTMQWEWQTITMGTAFLAIINLLVVNHVSPSTNCRHRIEKGKNKIIKLK